jgi:hypothetical protein
MICSLGNISPCEDAYVTIIPCPGVGWTDVGEMLTSEQEGRPLDCVPAPYFLIGINGSQNLSQ